MGTQHIYLTLPSHGVTFVADHRLHTCHDSALYPGAHADRIHAWCVFTQQRIRIHCSAQADIPLFHSTGKKLPPHQYVRGIPVAPTCSQTYITHTRPASYSPSFKHHHVSTLPSFVQTAAVKKESSTSKLRTNLPSLWVNGLVQANNRASPPCHFVLSTPSNYKFFQEMARGFHLLLKARGNFTSLQFHAPQSPPLPRTHTTTRSTESNSSRFFPRQSRFCRFKTDLVPLCSQIRFKKPNVPAFYHAISIRYF